MTVFTLFGILGNSGGGAIIGKIGMKKALFLGIAVNIASMICLIFSPQNGFLAYAWAACMGSASYIMAWIVVCAIIAVLGVLFMLCLPFGKKLKERYPD